MRDILTAFAAFFEVMVDYSEAIDVFSGGHRRFLGGNDRSFKRNIVAFSGGHGRFFKRNIVALS